MTIANLERRLLARPMADAAAPRQLKTAKLITQTRTPERPSSPIDISRSILRLVRMNITDLTQRPPRSPRVKLGGYVILPRMLDKGRAQLAGKAGEYHFACPLDQRLLSFTGLSAEEILNLLKQGKSDTEVLAWIRERLNQNEWEIAAWSEYQNRRGPSDNESREHFNESIQKLAPDRDDLVTWFDLLEIDDYVSFGGAA